MACVVLVVALIANALAQRDLRERELERLRESLHERARLAAAVLEERPIAWSEVGVLDALADRAGAAAAARVTLIDPKGQVVGDSEVGLAQLGGLDTHSTRPEVEAARRDGLGHSLRRSDTVGRELLYLALALPGGGVLRVASELTGIEAAQVRLRWQLASAAAIGLGVALALSYLLGLLLQRPLLELRRVAASLAGGDLDSRLPLRWSAELGEIAGSIHRMGEQLRQRLAETTAEKERLQAVVEGMVEGVLVVDARGLLVMANDRWREFYGVWGELRGRRLLEVVRDTELHDLLEQAGAAEEPVSQELRSGRGAPRTLRVHATRFPASGRERLGTVAVFHDVSELARLEQVRRDFVANASHELRTPLAAIHGFAETLLGGGPLSEAERRAYLEIIDRHARRLTNIVSDLLDLARLERTEQRLELAEVDVGALVQRLLADAAIRFEEKQLAVSQRSAGDTRALADAGALEQILHNLVDNAIKYTDPGGRIELEVAGEERCVRVRVRDSGVGIPSQDLDRIFERFYRVDKARSRALGGTGLGLSIVKHLVQRMGGEISVESALGQGTCMSFSVPRSAGVQAAAAAL